MFQLYKLNIEIAVRFEIQIESFALRRMRSINRTIPWTLQSRGTDCNILKSNIRKMNLFSHIAYSITISRQIRYSKTISWLFFYNLLEYVKSLYTGKNIVQVVSLKFFCGVSGEIHSYSLTYIFVDKLFFFVVFT